MIDLFDETSEDLTACGYETVGLGRFNATCSRLFVDTLGKAKKLGFGRGHYFILNAPNLSFLMEEHRELLKEEIKQRFAFLIKENKIKKTSKVLFVGIGNPAIPADCFGVRTAEMVEIKPFKKNNRFFKIIPNVFVNTGLNAYEIIRLLVEGFVIDAVVLFDSLATSNISRLGTSIQFNDAGLTPGSAMNNFGMAINKDTLGVPCLCVGVPLMISSKSFGEIKEIILTEKDVNEKVEFLSKLVAEVVNETF